MISNCSTTVCWKDYLVSIVLPVSLCQKSVHYVCVTLFQGSLFCSIHACILSPLKWYLDYSSFIFRLRIFLYDSSSFLLLISNLLSKCRSFFKITCWYLRNRWDFDWSCTDPINWFGKTDALTILAIYEHRTYPIYISFDLFHQSFTIVFFSTYRSCMYFVRFIAKYFNLCCYCKWHIAFNFKANLRIAGK